MARPFPDSQIWPVIDWLGDHTAIPESWSIHLISLQCVFKKVTGRWMPVRIWTIDPPSLFMNGAFFIMLRLPFWIGIQIRPFTERYFQCGIGWKGNGRLGILFRFLHDDSAAAGMDGPNYGQATYMNDGNK
jgi:hypothetical protein